MIPQFDGCGNVPLSPNTGRSLDCRKSGSQPLLVPVLNRDSGDSRQGYGCSGMTATKPFLILR